MCSAGGIRRPIQIEEFKTAISGMSDMELAQIKTEIENSINHLQRSNARLGKYIAKLEGADDRLEADDSDDLENIDSGDLALCKDSVRENEIVLNNYNERVDALEQETVYRKTGHGKSKHEVEAKDNTNKGPDVDMDNSNVDVVTPNSIFI
ncbi:BFP_1a_G0007690.mRNA.1.CDS.1 [Saccharomyces cerevisiae]|nr:BFP_1a_G0007690.mRNA.1.CDS.1 [Saccharomyces cerevisiae]CAI7063418.1 BFP_1a_G0007690.mRNA.1.CDS.1 [Saccharomyces cerevisiae]